MYIYKKLNYDQALEAWLARHPEFKELKERMNSDEDIPTSEFLALSARYNKLLRSMPKEETIVLEPGSPVIDLVTGPLTARKLLLHVRCPRRLPDKVIMDVLNSQKAKHKFRGPYHHKVLINVYCENMECWNNNFKQLEVDLWQDISEDVLADVAKAREAVSMPVQITRTFRY